MKQILFICLLLGTGYCIAQTTGTTKNKTIVRRVKIPEGMKYVPSGAMKMQGGDNGTATGTFVHEVQLVGFYMDATEVTNAMYRQFTNYVRDSIANTLLGNFETQPDGTKKLMIKKIDWKDPEVLTRLSAILLAGETFTGGKRIDPGKLQYHYQVFDYRSAKNQPEESRLKFIRNYDVAAYPDTTTWSRSLSTFNDPIASQYYSFKGFNNYPVVGVNLHQCNAFCDWRTKMWQEERQGRDEGVESQFRLPTEQEWERASRGGNEQLVPFTQSAISANPFSGGNFRFENSDANEYGMRNMAGGVSEWTITEAPGNNNAHIVRGGNWAYAEKDQQATVRFAHRSDSATAYIGFRCVFSQVFVQMK